MTCRGFMAIACAVFLTALTPAKLHAEELPDLHTRMVDLAYWGSVLSLEKSCDIPINNEKVRPLLAEAFAGQSQLLIVPIGMLVMSHEMIVKQAAKKQDTAPYCEMLRKEAVRIGLID